MVAAHVAVELGHREVAATVTGGVDKALVDEPRARRAELLRSAVHDRGDVAGGVFAGAKLRHGAQVLKLELRRALGADSEERFVELRLDATPSLVGDTVADRLKSDNSRRCSPLSTRPKSVKLGKMPEDLFSDSP